MNSGVGTSAEYYEEYYGSRDWTFSRRVLATIIAHSQPGPMLDVGAGLGFFVEAADRWGLDCEGIDGSVDAIEAARKRYPRIRVRHHLLSDTLPYPDESFQTISAIQVIEHLEQEVGERFLLEAQRILKPGGMLYIASPSRFNRAEARADPTHLRLYSPSELEHLLREVGYVRIKGLNAPLLLLGHNSFSMAIMTGVFRLTSWQRLSATATLIAYKAT